MTPLSVKSFMVKRQEVSIRMLSEQFQIDVGLAQALIQFWVKKGRCVPKALCGDCQVACDSQVYYRWI